MIEPRVVGIDASLTSTGIASPTSSVHRVGGGADLGDTRLCLIRDELRSICTQVRPCLAVIERPFTQMRGGSSVSLGMVQGVIRMVLLDLGVPYALVSPMQLKLYAAGSSKASKSDLRMALYKRAGIDEPCDDLVDAWWLRHMGLDRLGKPPVALPASQRAVLDKVDWPMIEGMRCDDTRANR